MYFILPMSGKSSEFICVTIKLSDTKLNFFAIYCIRKLFYFLLCVKLKREMKSKRRYDFFCEPTLALRNGKHVPIIAV